MIRNYRASDEPQWLSTRLLAFFNTNYYDDVKRAKTTLAPPSIELVDASATEIVGLLDVEIDGETATIDTIFGLITAGRASDVASWSKRFGGSRAQ